MSENGSWLCTVCGYIHEGETAPDCCPICGATSDLFEPHTVSAVPPPTPATTHWRCLNCDYVHQGAAPPEVCPVCGAGCDKFEALPPLPESAPENRDARRVIIVGAGVSGISAAEAVRKAAPDAKITVLSREPDLPYYRLNLTRYLAGEIEAAALPIHPESWYRENHIDLLLSAELQNIDPVAHHLQLRDHRELSYDRLIMATGAHPFVPPIPGVNRENVVTLRTLADAEALLRRIVEGVRCVVIGGGILGLEAAAALARRGARVTLVEGFGWLLPRQLNRSAGVELARYVKKVGIELMTEVRIKQLDGDEQVREVVLESGQTLPAEMVLVAAGVRSNTFLARLAKLDVNNGIVVDNYLQASAPDIYAVGDACEHAGISYGTWAPAQFQGTIAGMNATGNKVSFAGIPRSNLLKVLGVELFSIGNVHPDDGSYQTYELREQQRYAYLVFRDSRLVGAILLGDTSLSAPLKKHIEQQSSCAELLTRFHTADELLTGLASPG